MKKISIFLIALFVFVIPSQAFATNSGVETIDELYLEKGEISLLKGMPDDYYIEKGQINLETISDKLYIESNKVEINGEFSQVSEQLFQTLENSSELNEVLVNCLEDGDIPTAIGYTKVYLKEELDSDGAHLEPITVNEMAQINSTGMSLQSQSANSIKGNLTLYTVVTSSTAHGGSIHAMSCAVWSSAFQASTSNRAAEYPDYISISAPSVTGYLSSDFEAYATGFLTFFKSNSNYAWQADQGKTSVVYAFNEFVSGLFKVDDAYARMWVTKNTTNTNRTFVSKYVHTYGNTAPSISIGTSGVSFILNNTSSSWQIASSVNY